MAIGFCSWWYFYLQFLRSTSSSFDFVTVFFVVYAISLKALQVFTNKSHAICGIMHLIFLRKLIWLINLKSNNFSSSIFWNKFLFPIYNIFNIYFFLKIYSETLKVKQKLFTWVIKNLKPVKVCAKNKHSETFQSYVFQSISMYSATAQGCFSVVNLNLPAKLCVRF